MFLFATLYLYFDFFFPVEIVNLKRVAETNKWNEIKYLVYVDNDNKTEFIERIITHKYSLCAVQSFENVTWLWKYNYY